MDSRSEYEWRSQNRPFAHRSWTEQHEQFSTIMFHQEWFNQCWFCVDTDPIKRSVAADRAKASYKTRNLAFTWQSDMHHITLVLAHGYGNQYRFWPQHPTQMSKVLCACAWWCVFVVWKYLKTSWFCFPGMSLSCYIALRRENWNLCKTYRST